MVASVATWLISHTVLLNVQSDQLAVGCEMPIFPSLYETRTYWEAEYVSSYFIHHRSPCKRLINHCYLQGNLFSFYEFWRTYKWTIHDEQVRCWTVFILTACDISTFCERDNIWSFPISCCLGLEFSSCRALTWWQVWSPVHQLFGRERTRFY